MTPEQETAELEAIVDFHDQAIAEIKRLTEEVESLKEELRSANEYIYTSGMRIKSIVQRAAAVSPELRAMIAGDAPK